MLSHYRKNIPNFTDFAAAMTEKIFSGDESALSAIIDDLAPYDIFDFTGTDDARNKIYKSFMLLREVSAIISIETTRR